MRQKNYLYFFLYTLIYSLLSFDFIYGQENNQLIKNEPVIFRYDNGVISSEGFMRDGKPDGYWKNYYLNGIIKNEGNRKNFQLDSSWKFYYEKGKIQRIINYTNGKKEGFTFNYDTSGFLISKDFYKNDSKQGNSYTFYPNGKLKQIIPFINGKIDGQIIELNEDSLIISIATYKMGFMQFIEKINQKDKNGLKQGIWKEFYSTGKVKKETRYINDVVDGYSKEFDNTGNLKNIEKFSNGKKIESPPELAKLDVFKAYYENGNVRYEGGYVNGLPIGIHFHYKLSREICDSILVYEDTISKKIWYCTNFSIPDSAIIFQDGYLIEKGPVDSLRKKQGIWTEYHLTGEFKAKGNYLNDNKTGEWIYYYPNGKVEQKGKYDKRGRPNGEWIWYYENGNILRKENYISGKLDGLFEEFSSNGDVITKGEYLDDMKEGSWFYGIENYKEFGVYRAGYPDSIWKAFYKNENRLRFEGSFLSGEPEGKHIWYYSDGRIQSTGKFIAGIKEGNWKYYSEDGEIELEVTYENGIETKWDGIKIIPTYEESLRVYDTIKSKEKPSEGKSNK